MAKFTVTNTAPFKYRYICEQCEKQTDWLDASYDERKEVDSGFLGNKEAAINAEAEQFWSKSYPSMQGKLNNGEYNLSINNFDGKCPSCGGRQSWERKMSSIGAFVATMIGLPLLGALMLTLFPGGTQSLGALLRLVLGWILVACGPISLILLIVEIIKQRKIKADMAKTTVRNKPEFQFPGRPKR